MVLQDEKHQRQNWKYKEETALLTVLIFPPRIKF